MRRSAALITAVICGALCAATSAVSDTYPSRPITMIVPFPAGGGVDAVARIVADRLSVALGQPIVLDNRGGAAGVVGTRLAAKAAADGYTLVMAHSGTVGINPFLYANPGYDPLRDFTPVGLISSTPIALMAHPSFSPRSVAELIAYAKKNPGKVNVGTPPAGTGSYLAAELFNAMSGAQVQIVPFRGTGQLTNDLLGGHIPVAFNVLAPAMGAIQAGTLRVIAVAGPQRSSLLPDVPTAIESGLPDFEAVLHYGLMAPIGTPADIVGRLNHELRKVVSLPEVRERITADAGDPLPSTPEEYRDDIRREGEKWGPLIRRLNLKVE